MIPSFFAASVPSCVSAGLSGCGPSPGREPGRGAMIPEKIHSVPLPRFDSRVGRRPNGFPGNGGLPSGCKIAVPGGGTACVHRRRFPAPMPAVSAIRAGYPVPCGTPFPVPSFSAPRPHVSRRRKPRGFSAKFLPGKRLRSGKYTGFQNKTILHFLQKKHFPGRSTTVSFS